MDDSLSFESFLAGAKKAAFKAMEDHGRREYDEFALHGGVAIERLAKAALVKRNPVYLLEMGNRTNPDLLLYFGGHLDMEPDKIKTVGARDAVKRLRTLKVLPPSSQLDKLIELRNGTAHTSGGDEAKALLPTLAETIAILLKDVGLSIEQFWRRWTSAVNVAVDKQRDTIQRDVEIRIKQARHFFEDRFKDLPEDAIAQVLTTSELYLSRFDPGLDTRWLDELPTGGHYYYVATVDCPACRGPATVRLLPSEKGTVPTSMDILHCNLCDLYLTGLDEVKASGARSPFQSSTSPRLITITGVGPVPVLAPEQVTES
jgi:hypothetical protein